MKAHEQFADDLALLASGTPQGEERVALEKHLEGCAVSRRALLVLVLTSTYSLVTILLVALRLTLVIHWSWLWILSPLWLPLVIAGVVIAGLAAADRI